MYRHERQERSPHHKSAAVYRCECRLSSHETESDVSRWRPSRRGRSSRRRPFLLRSVIRSLGTLPSFPIVGNLSSQFEFGSNFERVYFMWPHYYVKGGCPPSSGHWAGITPHKRFRPRSMLSVVRPHGIDDLQTREGPFVFRDHHTIICLGNCGDDHIEWAPRPPFCRFHRPSAVPK